MTEKLAYPCPCGGKVKWKREAVIRENVDCGVLDVEYCESCGEEYLPEESMRVVEQKMKEVGLWGVERKEIKFWKVGKAVVLRLPVETVKKLGLLSVKKGFLYQEGEGKLTIEY